MARTGTLLTFLDSYGFIKCDDGNGDDDVFCHYSQVNNGSYEDMVVGCTLSFDVEVNLFTDEPFATNVTILGSWVWVPLEPSKGKGKGKSKTREQSIFAMKEGQRQRHIVRQRQAAATADRLTAGSSGDRRAAAAAATTATATATD